MSQGSGIVKTRTDQFDGKVPITTGEETEISNEIKFEEKDGAIVISWTAIPDTDNYTIIAKRKGKPTVEVQSTKAHCELQTKDHAWETGEVIVVHIFGENKENQRVEVCKEYRYIIGGDRVPGEFIATLHENNPSGAIELRWDGARKKPDSYDVTVHENHKDDGLKVARYFPTTKTSEIVNNLKPSTEYSSRIVAKYSDKVDGQPILSNTITTAERPDMSQVPGNVKNIRNELEKKGETAERSAGKGAESVGKRNAQKPTNKSDMKEKAPKNIASDAIASTKTNGAYEGTDISQKIDFQEKNDAIVLSWNAIENAKNYKIFIKRKRGEKHEKNCQVTTYSLRSRDYKWVPGEVIYIDIVGVDKKHDKVSICKDCKYIVGGDTVPGDFTLSHNKSNPSKALDLSWHQPKRKPLEYELSVYEPKEGKDIFKTSLCTANTMETIGELLPFTEYSCTLVAKYPDSSSEKPVFSNILKTDKIKKSSSPKKNTAAPKYSHGAQEVEAYAATDNPVRQIVVTWETPPTIQISHYEVCLLYGEKLKTETVNVGMATKARFHNLISNTTYTARVVTVEKFLNRSHDAYSERVTTEQANRSENFDINTAGKATITTCQPVIIGNNIASDFKWSLPDLGEEANNYRLLWVSASIQQEGKEKLILVVEEDNCKAKPVFLEWGEAYTFTVSCNFMDLDTIFSSESISSESFTTDIQKPKIENVQWHENELVVHWSSAQGASQYILKIMNENNEVAYTSNPLGVDTTTASIEMDKPYSYGKKCNFVLVAKASGSKEQGSSDVTSVLIGGKKAVTNVLAKKDRRRLEVLWDPPQKIPNEYKILLYDMSEQRAELVERVRQRGTSHAFNELKCSTPYSCRVHPIYDDGGEAQGTLSNLVTTAKRNKLPQESRKNFGRPEKIMHEVTSLTRMDAVDIEVSWSTAQVGENYKVVGYHFIMVEIGMIYNSNVVDKELGADNTIRVQNVKKGFKYLVKLSTRYKDLDTLNLEKSTAEYRFSTKPSQTKITGCTLNNGVITFKWQEISGATKYLLQVQDEFQSEELLRREEKGCMVTFEMTEKLRIGITCMAKVTVFAADDLTQTDWKTYLIGGDHVPRNVKVTRIPENPNRALNIAFDQPRNGPASEYKIVALPECGGRQKSMLVKTSPFVFRYLRKGVSYKFEVAAKRNDGWSTASQSNSESTAGNKAENPYLGLKNMERSTVNLSGANLYGSSTSLNMIKGDDFGKIRDIRPNVIDRGEKDFLTLHWKVPSFDNHDDDYKVEKYKVEVRKSYETSGGRIYYLEFVEDQFEYSTKEFELDRGETYDVSVSTIYEDIDQDKSHMSSAARHVVITRPCKPTIIRHDCKNDALTVEWNDSKGAQRYEIEIFTENSATSTISKNMEKETVFTKNFDEKFGYGTTYRVVVTAYNSENKKNSVSTNSETIGGQYVPTNVIAKSNHSDVKDPNNEMYMEWTAPKLPPISYRVSAEPKVVGLEEIKQYGVSCLVSGLKAGTYYIFKVMAVHKVEGKDIISGGCPSERIQTNPTPTQIKNVWVTAGHNPSTSANIFWSKVDAEKADETTKYRVHLKKSDEKSNRELHVKTEKITFEGLEPGATYFVTVAGGNSIGYGRDSERIMFSTELGTPKDVILKHHKENLSSSAVLTFSNAEGDATQYIATLYKYQNQVKYQVREPEEVKSEHVYSDLESNSEYLAEVQAVFGTAEGKVIKSNKVTTAPSKATIIESGSKSGEDKQKSSRIIFAKWNPETRCNFHQIRVNCGKYETFESQLFTENTNEIEYCCLYEATKYSIQVRSRNSSGNFGQWSDKSIIDLAPAKLEGITAKLEGYDMLVQCRPALRHSPFYFMRALCEGTPPTQPTSAQHEAGHEVVQWKFQPPENAKKYVFEIWGEDSDKTKGESTFSNPVMSRPSTLAMKTAKALPEAASTDIEISWDPQDRCDAYNVSICLLDQEKPEAVLKTTETSYIYKCRHPGNIYLVSIRAVCESVPGEWSEYSQVALAPAMLQGVTAELKETDILVQCRKALLHSPSYCMRALCDNKPATQSQRAEPDAETGIVQWKFTPENAQKYVFELWAEDSDNLKGESTFSNTIISKPSKLRVKSVKAVENAASTDIEISWDPQERCTAYEVRICVHNQENPESIAKTSETVYLYRCCSPGNTYLISVRAICESVFGEWSADKEVILAPDEVELIEDSRAPSDPVKLVMVAWRPLRVKPEGYLVKVFCNEDEVDEVKTVATELSFQQHLKPGSLCYCTVAAYNINHDGGLSIGKPSQTRSYRIEWVKPRKFFIKPDENDSSRRAKLEWDRPDGVNCFRIDIENNQSGVICSVTVLETKYVFESGVPGNTYTVRLHCGCDGRYDTDYMQETMVMTPEAPTDVKVMANGNVNGLTIEFKDGSSTRKQYEVTAEPLSKPAEKLTEIISQHRLTLRDLVPGESYLISVATIIRDSTSNVATSDGYVRTLPDEVRNLRSKIENGSVLFEWDKLDIKPDKYIVQWRVDNEPITDEHTQASSFMIFFLKPAHCYSVRVMAENSSGIGPMSLWENFITDPSPPYNVNVYPDPESPETSLIVKFQDEKDYLKRYRITAKGRDEEPKIVVTHEHFAILTDLKSGREYMVTVQTLFGGKESAGAAFSRI